MYKNPVQNPVQDLSVQDPCRRSLNKGLYEIFAQGLFKRSLDKISVQGLSLYIRSLSNPCKRSLYKISGLPAET